MENILPLSQIVGDIENIPFLPSTIAEIDILSANHDSSVNDIVNCIAKDPLLTAAIIKSSNSAFYAIKREIISLTQAVSLLGINTTRLIAIGDAARETLRADFTPYQFSTSHFAEVSLARSFLAKEWLEELYIDDQIKNKLLLASFIMDTGMAIIARHIATHDLVDKFQNIKPEFNDFFGMENEVAGISSPELTAMIFEKWGFDEDVIQMIRYSSIPAMAGSKIKEAASILYIIRKIVPYRNADIEEEEAGIINEAMTMGLDANPLQRAIEKYIIKLNDQKNKGNVV